MTLLRRWWPLIALLALAFNLRPVAVSIGPVLAEISRDVGLSGTTAGLLTSLPTLGFAVFGAVAPWLAHRIGAHRTILLSLIALIVGQAGRLLVHSPVPFLLLSTLALGGMAQANVLLPSLVRRHYPNHIGLATALYSLLMTIGVTLAGTVTVPLAHVLGGWRASLSAGVVIAVAATLCWLPLALQAGKPKPGGAMTVSLAAVARTRLGWAMAIMFGIQSSQAYAVFGWLPSIYRSAGMDQTTAGYMLGIATGVGIVPAFLIPAYVARTRNPSVLFLSIIACLVAGWTGLLIDPMAAPAVWAVLIALGTSSFPLLLALFGTRAHTPNGTAALSGFAQSVGYLLATIGPLGFGVLYASFDSWVPPILLQMTLIIPMVIAGLYACQPRIIEEQLPGLEAV
ncbi:MAG: MFS transporter [Propionibacteriaceae bacterium]|nr:MFS transporter [Propionibacteriaceae bacterium]